MELSFEENRFLSNRAYVVDCSGEGGGDTKVEESRDFCGEISSGEQIDCVIGAANMVYNMRNEKLTEGDREMIDDCEKMTMKRFGYIYEVGDLIWGKVRSHPWWPGQIYNEAFALPCARNAKREGHVLVAFFGDNSYEWFDPTELIPFDINYVEKSKQTNDREFVKAVEEAENEASRRAAVGLLCHCRNPSSFRATGVKGFVEVDVHGYQPGGLYSVKQIKSARDGFQPVEMLCLLQELACAPHSSMKRSINWVQNVAVVLAYRKAVFEEVDETYAQAFPVQPICNTDSCWALDLQEELPSQASLDGLLTPEKSFICFSNHKKSALSAGHHVVQRRGPPACIITDFPVGSISTTQGPGHSGKEATTLKKQSVPKISSRKAIVNREANRVENCEISKGFKQFQPRFSKVAKTSHHLKHVKVVGRTAPPSDALLHNKVLVQNDDNLDEKPAVFKSPGEEILFEKSLAVNKKKRKKELSLEFPHNHPKNAENESSSGTPNSISSDFVGTEQMVDRRSTSSNNSWLFGFLLDLALDPFHKEQHNILATVLEFFLQYRSTVYKKHFVLDPAAETELLEGPSNKSPAFDADAKKPYCRIAQDLPSSLKPPKKRLKLYDYANVGRNPISDSGKGVSKEELNDLKEMPTEKKAGAQKLEKSLRRNERKTNLTVSKKLAKDLSKKPDTPTRATKPTMILMQFPRQSAMPSVSELKARFARFGHLHSAPQVFWKYSTCQVVFKYETNAKAAYSYAVESKSIFGSVKVEYCLQSLEVPATEFPKSFKELAGKALDEVSPFKPMSTGDSTKLRSAMAPQHHLLHPTVQPKSCLKKQQSNELESTIIVHSKTPHIKVISSNGGSSSCAAANINAKNSPLLPVSPNQTSYINENSKIAHFAEVCNMLYLQLKAKNNSVCTTTTNTESIDISAQVLSLLMRCSEIVADLKFSLGYMPLNL